MRLLARACCLLLLVATASADWTMVEDNWYSVELGGDRVGWSRKFVERDDQHVRSTFEQTMKIARASNEMEIVVTMIFLETHDGDPISALTRQVLNGMATDSLWEFEDTELVITTTSGASEHQSTAPLPDGDWLTPNESRTYVRSQLEKANEITFRTLSPDLGTKPITIVMSRSGEGTRDVFGESTPVSIWTVVNDRMPVASSEAYTEDGISAESTVNAGFGAIRQALTTEANARQVVTDVPELMLTMLVAPDKPIPGGFAQRTLSMRLRTKDGTLLDIPTIGAQRATAKPDGVLLEVDIDDPHPATPAEQTDATYTTATAMCDSSDLLIRQLAERATRRLQAGATTVDRAEAMRSFVYNFVDAKDLGTGFASASSTAVNRKGDCSEHSVLLCALLRADGIPSRAAIGMVYIPDLIDKTGRFGWHMWSQALIDGKWMDLDATLPVRFSAGHIATGTTALSDASLGGDMAAMMGIMGNLEVEILDSAP